MLDKKDKSVPTSKNSRGQNNINKVLILILSLINTSILCYIGAHCPRGHIKCPRSNYLGFLLTLEVLYLYLGFICEVHSLLFLGSPHENIKNFMC